MLCTCGPYKGKRGREIHGVQKKVPWVAFILRLHKSQFGVIYLLKDFGASSGILDLRDL